MLVLGLFDLPDSVTASLCSPTHVILGLVEILADSATKLPMWTFASSLVAHASCMSWPRLQLVCLDVQQYCCNSYRVAVKRHMTLSCHV